MKTNYIRVNTSLVSSPKLVRLSSIWECSFENALGSVVKWLSWLDQHTTDGKTGLKAKEIDRMLFYPLERVEGLKAISWAAEDDDGNIYAVEFNKYNGPTAKARMAASARKRKSRAKTTEHE